MDPRLTQQCLFLWQRTAVRPIPPFCRYLTPFKAEWDPKDPTESVFVIGRCASDTCRAKGPIPLSPLLKSTLLKWLQ